MSAKNGRVILNKNGGQQLKQIVRKSAQLIAAAFILASPSGLAQSYAMDSEIGVSGEELFPACAFCHGPQAQGGPAVDAPPLAGMEAWYIERQLNNFKSRIRGNHPDDVPGLQMSIVSGMTRNDATLSNIATHLEAMESGGLPELYYGEPITNANRNYIWDSPYAVLDHPEPASSERGEALYTATCSACHGPLAQGNEQLGSPKLTDLPDWYMHRQIQYFRDGLRGSDPRDIFGMQMALFAKMLANNQAIADVTAYIQSLEVE